MKKIGDLHISAVYFFGVKIYQYSPTILVWYQKCNKSLKFKNQSHFLRYRQKTTIYDGLLTPMIRMTLPSCHKKDWHEHTVMGRFGCGLG